MLSARIVDVAFFYSLRIKAALQIAKMFDK